MSESTEPRVFINLTSGVVLLSYQFMRVNLRSRESRREGSDKETRSFHSMQVLTHRNTTGNC